PRAAAARDNQCVNVIWSDDSPVIFSRASSKDTFCTSMPGICSALTCMLAIPVAIGSGDRPGSENELESSKTEIDQSRAHDSASSSIVWKAAPAARVKA